MIFWEEFEGRICRSNKQQQIPCGDDNKKGNSSSRSLPGDDNKKGDGKYGSSFQIFFAASTKALASLKRGRSFL
jgi:hypothetical protein